MKRAEAEKRAYELLRHIGLSEKANAYPASLSGGQKQRIGIARAFLKNASILILDEATSSLDNENEAEIYNSLERLCANKTTIIIAHRLTTIKNADRIFVLSNKKIAESGSHEDLMKAKGVYYNLYNRVK